MRKRKKRYSPLAFILSFLMVFQVLTPAVFGEGGAEVYDVLQNIEAHVFQDGTEIESGGTLDPDKAIKIKYTFDVPVEGDYPTPDQWVNGGDTATFGLPNALNLTNTANQVLNTEGGVEVGGVTFSGNSAVVTFSSVLDEDGIMQVSASFEAEMEYDASGAPDEGGKYEVAILDKTFTVVVPPKEIPETQYDGEKTGTLDIANKTIDWVVRVSTTPGDGSQGDLTGFTLYEDLRDAGAYVDGSFKIGPSADEAYAFERTPNENQGIIDYTFTAYDGYLDEYYVFFKTEIPDEKFYSTGEQKIQNWAWLKKGEQDVGSTLYASVGFQMDWIEKKGKVVENSEGTEDKYSSDARTIEWTIQANQEGATIDNPVIVDTLQDGLAFESATIKYRQAGTEEWGAEQDIESSTGGSELTFELGEQLSGQEVLITVRTIVTDQSQAYKIDKFENSATLKSNSFPDGEIESAPVSVNIGINPISKTVGEYDVSTHRLNWTVNVNSKNQPYSGDLRVLDLLVYGDKFDVSKFSDLKTRDTLQDIQYSDLEQLTPQFNQKYAGEFSSDDGLELTVHHLQLDGKNVADVLVVTGADGAGIDYTKSNTFSFDTLVTNPDIYASNESTGVSNTATIFSGDAKKNDSTASTTIQSNMLQKDMMTRDDAIALEEDSNDSTAVNANPAGESGAFRYDDKSVIFKIHVNSNGLTNATQDVTTVDGETMGDFVVTDTLPKGWEFKKLHEKDFLIYDKDGTLLGEESMGFLTSTQPTVPTENTGATMTFTFSELTQPYVILVKAGPTAETADEYFSKNESYSVENTVEMSNDHYSGNVTPSDKEKVTFESKLLEKTYGILSEGVLLWQVEYKPYNLEHEQAYIEDTMPVGLDLPMDAQGNLIVDGNIHIYKLNLNVDGTYSTGEEVDVESVRDLVVYQNDSRILRFNLPDTQQAYRITYQTDITGDPGASLTNKVTLYATQDTDAEASMQYVVSNADAGASFKRGGWLEVTKTDENESPLAGAEFTLFAKDGITAIRAGISGNDGVIRLKAITPGEYTLKETKAPEGYNISNKTYQVVVVKGIDDMVTTTIDDTNSNKITVTNILSGTIGDLRISKTVEGNRGDKTKEFSFTVDFSDKDASYPYVKSGAANGMIQSGDTITLTHGQDITITSIPKEVTYTVTEADYTSEGYKTEKTGDTGVIEADQTAVASFINTKNRSGGGGGGSTPDPVLGSVKIVKVDGDNSSKTLSGAVFELLDANENVVETSALTKDDGEVRFEGLQMNVEYFIREKEAPEGYMTSDNLYTFQLIDQSGKRDITIRCKNYKEEEEVPPVDPEEPKPEEPKPEEPKPEEPTNEESPKESNEKEKENLYEIDPEGTPTTGLFDEGVPKGGAELDDTPKTGVNLAAKGLLIALAILSGCGLILLEALRRKKFKA